MLQEDLHWNKYQANLWKKLSCSTGLLSKIIRHYVPKYLLKIIYFSIFNSHLIYACKIWGQNKNMQWFKKLFKLQERALQIINFQPPAAPTNNLFSKIKVLKIPNFIKYRFALFVCSSVRTEGVLVFNVMFTIMSHNHNHIMQGSVNHLSIPQGGPLTLEITLSDLLPLKFWIIFTDFQIVIF